jgi:hypothetical protein
LSIEEEGLLPILERANIAERLDVALMSTKDMSVVASRNLIDVLQPSPAGRRKFRAQYFDPSARRSEIPRRLASPCNEAHRGPSRLTPSGVDRREIALDALRS